MENAVYVLNGAPVGLPPPGASVILIDGTGAVKLMDSNGNRTAIGGAAAMTPAQVALARAQALLGTTVNAIEGTHFYNDQWHATTGTAGATVTMSTANRAGVVILDSSVIASGTAQLSPHGQPSIIGAPNSDKWYLYVRAAVTTAIDAQAIATMGLEIPALNVNGPVRMGVIGSEDASNFSYQLRAANGSTLVAHGSLGVAADTNFHDWEAWSDGTNLSIAIDGVVKATNAVSGIASASQTYHSLVQNGTTAASRKLAIDAIWIATPSN